MIERMTAANARELFTKKKRKGKYGAKKTVVDGITFDSRAEAKRYGELLNEKKADLIRELEVHPVYTVEIHCQHVCTYTADFSYRRRTFEFDEECRAIDFEKSLGWIRVIEDVKSKGTRRARDWPLKKRLIEAFLRFKITEVVR